MAKLHIELDAALALAGRGCSMHPVVDRCRQADANTIEFWSSDDWRDGDDRAKIVLRANGDCYVQGFVFASISELDED